MVLSVSSASGWQEMAPLIAHVPGQKRLENQANRRLRNIAGVSARARLRRSCCDGGSDLKRRSERTDWWWGFGVNHRGAIRLPVSGSRIEIPPNQGGARTWSCA